MQIPGLRVAPDLASVPWKRTQVPGVQWFPLHLDDGDASDDPRIRPGGTVLIRMEPGHGYEPHRHLGDELVLVLQGGYRDELGSYPTGTFVRYPAGSRHHPIALGDPARPASEDHPACVLFAVAGGTELLER